MKITPLEIRQRTFEKHFRGYDKDEVNAFLLTMSQEWERMLDDNKELRIKLESTEREVMKLREVESSLYKTLKTAEDTGASVIEQARQAADLHLKESQLKAEAVLNEAKMKARDAMDEAEMRSKEVIAEMEERVKLMVENYKKLESSREDLIIEIRRLSNDILERVERAKNMSKEFNPDQYLNNVRREIKRTFHLNNEPAAEVRELKLESVKEPLALPPIERAEVVEQKTLAFEGNKKVFKSFFDEIG